MLKCEYIDEVAQRRHGVKHEVNTLLRVTRIETSLLSLIHLDASRLTLRVYVPIENIFKIVQLYM
jgi:hypothetical protein